MLGSEPSKKTRNVRLSLHSETDFIGCFVGGTCLVKVGPFWGSADVSTPAFEQEVDGGVWTIVWLLVLDLRWAGDFAGGDPTEDMWARWINGCSFSNFNTKHNYGSFCVFCFFLFFTAQCNIWPWHSLSACDAAIFAEWKICYAGSESSSIKMTFFVHDSWSSDFGGLWTMLMTCLKQTEISS